jgi:predicted Fe-Mo cluster-binding NifX family protein
MKKAIAIKSRKEDAPLEYHFGKSPYFAILDDSGQMDIWKNEHSREPAAKGIMTANELSKKGVKKIIAGEFGVKVKPTLDVLGIKMETIDVDNKNLKQFLITK